MNSEHLPIYWMKGPAGVGKSAVAQTCVEKLKRQGKQYPAFFFSINGRNKHQKLFPSIAYQLATTNSDYHDLIDRKIRRHKTLVDKTMETQFWGLLVEPLQELEDQGKGIGERIPIFIDGLDECESKDAQCEIVEIIASAVRDGATPLCWAFFSRPDPHIVSTFSKAEISPLCKLATLPISHDADGDIKLYLKAGFNDILRRRNISMDSPWPSNSDMRELVRAAGGLFIYAKTVIRFVGQPDSLNPEDLLRAIIAVISNRNSHGLATEPIFAELDSFYALILRRIPTKIFPIIHRILAYLCWGSFSSAIMIANYLGLSRTELEVSCSHLTALVHFQRQDEPLVLDSAISTRQSILPANLSLELEVPDIIWDSLGGSISFYHKSFQDLLLDQNRSGSYCVRTTDEFFNSHVWGLALQFQKNHRWQGLGVFTPSSPS